MFAIAKQIAAFHTEGNVNVRIGQTTPAIVGLDKIFLYLASIG